MMPLKLKTEPFPHQRKATARAVKQGNHAFFFEPRCGKTKAVLDAIAVKHRRGEVRRVIVIAPIIALDVWVREIQTHMAVPTRVSQLGEVTTLYWPDHDSSINESIKLQMLLINYDKFSRRGKEESYRNRFVRVVERWRPDIVVLDESHRVKNSGAVRSQAIWRMVRRLREKDGEKPWVYLMTGTPNPKSYIDIFSQYRILNDGIFGTTRQDFEDRYVVRGFGRNRFRIIRYRNKKFLLKKIRAVASVVTQDQAGLRGEEFFNPIHVSLPEKARKAYHELAEQYIAEIEGEVLEATNPAVRRLRLLQLTGGFTAEGKSLHSAKLEAAKDYLTDLFEQQEYVVVYARYLPEVASLREIGERVGYRTSVITGGVSRKDRTAAVAAFQSRKGDVPRLLVFQADTGSLAIELTAAAETLFYSLPDSWETFYQCTQRTGGPKQRRPVRHTFLIARGTVDSAVLDALRGKRDLHAEMMRSPRGFLYGF